MTTSKQVMDYPKRRAKGAAREMASAAAALRQFVRLGDDRSGLIGIGVNVKDNPSSPGVAYCIITIDSPTQEEVEAHGMELTEQGCVCTSTGEWSIECDCSDV